jgi:hypothetical protein
VTWLTMAISARCGSGGFSSRRRISRSATNPTTVGSNGLRSGVPESRRGVWLGRYKRGECKHAKMESGEGPERGWCGLLPCRSGGSFLPSLTDAEQGGCTGVSGRTR